MSIVAENLEKRYGTLRAVDGVSFEMPGPGIVGLIGPNGAGKTTTLRMLTTYLAPTAGRAIIEGFDCWRESIQARRRLGYLPEASALPTDARVDELLGFRAKLKQVPRRLRRGEIDRTLQLCDLAGVRKRMIGRLSHGMRRRVALADALLNDPPVLILDEPTAGLDPLQVRQFRSLLSELAENHTILLSTHILAEAEAVCQRVLVLSRGRLVEDIDLQSTQIAETCRIEVQGPVDSIQIVFTASALVGNVRLLGSEGDWHRFEISANVGVDVRAELGDLCLQYGWRIRELSADRLTLEQRFIRSVFNDQRKAA